MAVYGGPLLNPRVTDVHVGSLPGGSGLAENLTIKKTLNYILLLNDISNCLFSSDSVL